MIESDIDGHSRWMDGCSSDCLNVDFSGSALCANK